MIHQSSKCLPPHDLIDIAMQNSLQYDVTQQEGVMFHLISTLSQYGKMGLVCIGATPQRVREFYEKTLEVLKQEGVCLMLWINVYESGCW